MSRSRCQRDQPTHGLRHSHSTTERLGPVFELAVERSVPILIHGGRGLPDRGDLELLVRRTTAPSDSSWRTPESPTWQASPGVLGGMPGVLFDTSVWSGIDLLDLYRQVTSEQVVYASDYPYGRQPNSLLWPCERRSSGFDDKQLRLMLGVRPGESSKAPNWSRCRLEGRDLARAASGHSPASTSTLDGGPDDLAAPA